MPKVKLKKAVTLGRKRDHAPGETIEVSEEIEEYLISEGCVVGEDFDDSDEIELGPNEPPKVNNGPFAELEAVDAKTEGYLIKNGITNIEDLATTELKTLEDIHGISKKKAKEIFDSFESEEQEGNEGN